MSIYELERCFEYENGYMATAEPRRFSKFITHLEFFKMTSHLRGEIVELGVFKGNSLFRWIKFRELLENTYSRKIIAFDVFGDFPTTSFEDDKIERNNFIEETGGGVGISYEEITTLLQQQNLYKNIDLIKGNILETLPKYLKNNPHLKISLLHIDVDLYEASKVAIESLFGHVVRGVIVLDDYGAFAGTNKAIDDFIKDQEIRKFPYSYNISYIVKQ